ncbi:unnamed protein product [Arabidopsis thaliana]|uniref:GATA transcription factor n=1 Tax=Arabidopsis thaliana TaxID=3702 RepID=A0A654FVZ6_ARATH|nr:unnamed protein product [Arabidopsis thaliana]VYS65065.1 unnamed protein product [Arabidopsis thaliana]
MECVEAFLGDFSVDDLLDLSNADTSLESSSSQRKEDEQEREKFKSFSDQSTRLSPPEDLLSFPGDAPVGDLEDLEWLSNFVEDSFSESYISSDFPVNPVASVEVRRQCVPVKPRSKRRRTNGRIWSMESPSPLLSTAVARRKKRGRQKADASYGGVVQQQQLRRCCSHCGVQKTPQWRMGPLGAKTLCNACGVRFKSGRLLPEYRPACSPTFTTEIHSNSHRKVLELRLMKVADPARV